MKRTSSHLTAISIAVVLHTGCASVPQAYRPQNVGPGRPAPSEKGLRVSISPDSEVAVKGEPIQFSVEIENVSAGSLVVPRHPHVVFTWTYANGQRDNFLAEVPDEQFLAPSDVVRLEAGGTLRIKVPVKTYYFRRLGVTEFRAVVNAPRNTNPALGDVWQGRALSNRYGVLVTRGPTYAWLH